MEKESKIEFETEFEKIAAEIRSSFEYFLKYNPKSEEQIKKRKWIFLKKYFEKNIINMLTMKNVNLLVQEGCVIEKQKKGYECIVCNSPCCYICYKNYYNCKECLFCFSDDDSDFKYYLKIYFNENYYKQD
ncbi:hypothetical protein [Spiroplasma citri]|uniref:hypothetical protein n=1 Tax=Spiroplasma citri TaxID=2133 RepID=UPI00148B255C|nr:hypothetical protein [Spiroplasma citri]QJU62312.1 hypothetical protein HHA36_08400 [Spiroplasma citri]